MLDGRERAPRESSESPRVRVSQRHLLLLALIVVVALSLVYLWQSWRWISAYNELQQAQVRLEATEAEREQLRFDVERAFSLVRIERIATEQLDMKRPEPRYLDLSTSGDD